MKSLKFNGNGLEYFKIWIVNILLTIVTLGLYYPWAKVRNNRYFYANSTLEDRNFNYHATGKQLFFSYLIAMALFITYGVIQELFPIGGVIVLLIFLIALPWIVWRSLKFNMRITSFSNVRFGFEGKLGGAYFNYMLMPFVFFLSLYGAPIFLAVGLPAAADSGIMQIFVVLIALVMLGFAFYMFGVLKKKNASYFLNSARYGQGQFSTNLTASTFMKITLKTIGLFFLGMLAYMIIMAIVFMAMGLSAGLLAIAGDFDNPEAMQDIFASGSAIVAVIFMYLGFIAMSILVFSYSFSRQRTYIYANSSLDNKIGFKSTLGARATAWVSLTNLLAVIFSLGLAIPWAKVRMARLMLENTFVDTSVSFEEYVTQKQEEQSALGEEIGDAFDVDVGIGF